MVESSKGPCPGIRALLLWLKSNYAVFLEGGEAEVPAGVDAGHSPLFFSLHDEPQMLKLTPARGAVHGDAAAQLLALGRQGRICVYKLDPAFAESLSEHHSWHSSDPEGAEEWQGSNRSLAR